MVLPWLEMDARSYAMGGAYVAIAQGVAASYWNPAGLASSPWLQIQAAARPEISGADWQTLQTILEELQKDRPDPGRLPQNLDVQASVIGHGGVAVRTVGAGIWGWAVADARARQNSDEHSWQASYLYAYEAEAVAGGGLTVPTGLPGLGRVSLGIVGKRVVAGTGAHVELAGPGPNPGEVTVSRSTVRVEGAGSAMDLGVKLMVSPRWVVAATVKNLGLELAGTKRTTTESSTQSVAGVGAAGDVTTGVAGSLTAGAAVGRPTMIEPVETFTKKIDPSWRVGVATQPGLPGLVLAVDVDDQKQVHVGGELAAPWRMVSVRGGAVLRQETGPEYRVGLGAKLGILAADAAAGWQQGRLERVFVQAGLEF